MSSTIDKQKQAQSNAVQDSCPFKESNMDINNDSIVTCPIMAKMAQSCRESSGSLSKTHGANSGQPISNSNNNSTDCNRSENNTKCNSCCKGSGVKSSPVRTINSHSLGEGCEKSPKRKISNISAVSSSGGSDETENERKLDLRYLIEGIGTLLLPVKNMVFKALSEVVSSYDKDGWVKLKAMCPSLCDSFDELTENEDGKRNLIDEDNFAMIIKEAANIIDKTSVDILRDTGKEYFDLCLSKYGSAIQLMGSNMVEFFSNLDGLQTFITSSEKFNLEVPPSSRCEYEKNKIALHFYTFRRSLLDYYSGIVIGISKRLFHQDATVDVELSDSLTSSHHILYITTDTVSSPTECKLCSSHGVCSNRPSDSKISVETFCKVFPFHLILDKTLTIIQIGEAFQKHIVCERMAGKIQSLQLSNYFEVVRPAIEPLTYTAMLSFVNFTFTLRTKQADRNGCSQHMELKGQMIHLPEIEGILFLGSPSVEKLDELIEKGLYISDLPIHDATRDVILVGEQTKAQDGLRRRMEDLKKNIMKASAAVEEEKRKNVELLQMVFPSEIAQKLWRKETIEPQCIENVTMLFSDIVGFTAICSSCTPLDVINMLSALYTNFDHCCGMLDVYKVETIGDAYCVAGGLHRKSQYHATQIAWMALRMMDFAGQQKAHDGTVIKMRIGLHSGKVLAGVVGVTMPRYCLFGNNVTLANRFESGSEPTRINISPTTHSLLTDGFSCTPRSRDFLPSGFPTDVAGTCHFLDNYKFPYSDQVTGVEAGGDDISKAIKFYKIKEV